MNETKTLTLSQFLKDRYAEFEQVAKQAVTDYSDGPTISKYARLVVPVNLALEDIMSKRAIVDLHGPKGGECATCCGEPYMEEYWDGETETAEWKRADLAYPCPTLRLLAAPYRHHADFQEAWA